MIRLLKKNIKKFLNLITGINLSRRKKPADTDVNKILVISLYFAGDMLFHTAAIEVLRFLFPDAKIDIWTKSGSAVLLKDDSRFNEVIAFDGIKTSDYRNEEGIGNISIDNLLNKLNKNNYSIIIDLTGKKETAKAVKQIKSLYSIGLNYDYSGYCYDKFVYLDTANEKGHLISKYLYVIKNGFKIDDNKWDNIQRNIKIKPYLETGENSETEALNILKQKNFTTKKYLSIHLTSGWKAKELPKETFSEVLEKLDAKGLKCLIFGDDKDKERYDEIKLNSNINTNNIVFVNTQFNITAELIKNSALFIGSDSAPLHLAAAFEVPCIAFFGPTNPGFSAPLHEKSKVIYHKLICSASEDKQYCTRNGGFTCPKYDCMLSISAKEIVNEIDNILAGEKENILNA